MKKASAKEDDNDLRPEYDTSKLKGGVRGKYYRQATAGTNLVLIRINDQWRICFDWTNNQAENVEITDYHS